MKHPDSYNELLNQLRQMTKVLPEVMTKLSTFYKTSMMSGKFNAKELAALDIATSGCGDDCGTNHIVLALRAGLEDSPLDWGAL